MSRPGKGEEGYEKANARWRKTMEERYGGKEGLHKKMQSIGRIGGRCGFTGGFWADPERASREGARGGAISKRGYQFIGKDSNGDYLFKLKSNGKMVLFKKEEIQDMNSEIFRWIKTHPKQCTGVHSDLELAENMSSDFSSSIDSLSQKIGYLRRVGKISVARDENGKVIYSVSEK